MPNVEDSLLELERAGWDSLCNATGSEFYGAIMLPDALMVLANGMVMDRTPWWRRCRSRRHGARTTSATSS
jgi:hypothetical protein